MSKRLVAVSLLSIAAACTRTPPDPLTERRAQTKTGVVEGIAGADGGSVFKGIPYAAPPVGDLRWKAPQPPASWTGVRRADTFGNRCIQTNPYPDMKWQSPAESEDCLTLSIWTPAKLSTERLPVMVWIHGGGFFSGAGDEFRHEGTTLASKGVVLLHFNYRLGVIGFLAHPELTAETTARSSGNYGLLDQIALLHWVRDNIAAFGGDPSNITIFGESAGSFAVSALMASPLTDGLFHKAIGESGAFFSSGPLPALPLQEAEARGGDLGKGLNAPTIAALRALPPGDLVKAVGAVSTRFSPNVDGTALTEDPAVTFAAGRQRHVPLIAGWNSAETKLPKTTATAFKRQVQSQYSKTMAPRVLAQYPANDDNEAWLSAIALSSDNFMGYGTWKWIEVHAATGGSPVYRYLFDHLMPTAEGGPPPDDPGTGHAADIEYVFHTLDSRKLAWRDVDRRMADIFVAYWTNFAKTGSPNGAGVPEWPAYSEAGGRKLMRLKVEPVVEGETHRARYELLDEIEQAKRKK